MATSTRCGGKTVISMILVDSSVWIDHLRNRATHSVLQLRALMRDTPLRVGDLILCEVLRGCGSDREARLVERGFRQFEIVPLFDPPLAITAAANDRFLRPRGITIAKLADLIIGTFCIERDHTLLHSDRDFEPMERLLGLQKV
jgi:predicted nucleic acid-binding protein